MLLISISPIPLGDWDKLLAKLASDPHPEDMDMLLRFYPGKF
jgi:hypothetical protein